MLGFAPCCKSDLAILHNPPLAVACRAVSPYAFTTSIELTCSWLRCIKRFSTRWDAAFSELLAEKTWSKVFLSESQAYKTINLHNRALSVESNKQIHDPKAQYQFSYLRTGFGLAPAATSSEAKKLGGTAAFSSH